MKLQSSIATWIFLFLVIGELKIINGKLCGKDKYRIDNNGSITCLACNSCAYGLGLSPPCGSLIKHPPNVFCHHCKLGITYSDEHGPSSCKKCSHCSPHEIITKNCTVESDTVCSQTCETGFYYDNSSHNCQACSFCCGDSSDIKIAVCKTSPKQCSFHNADRCTPTKQTTMSTLIVTTALKKTNQPVEQKNIGIIVGVTIGVTVAVAVIVLLYCVWRKAKKRRIPEIAANNRAEYADGEQHQRLCCDLEKHIFRLKVLNYDGPAKNTKVPCGRELLLEVFCENENNNHCFRNFTFKWKKDGTQLEYEEYTLKIEHMSLFDSGSYQCCLSCQTHNIERESEKITMRVVPRQGEEPKLLKDIELHKKQRLQRQLKPKKTGVGNWENVGNHYGMDADTLTSIKDDDNRVEQVFEYLHSSRPKLTVLDFCMFLKTIKQNSAVDDLSNDLTVSTSESNESTDVSLNDTRDSGVDFEEHCSLRVRIEDNKESILTNKNIPKGLNAAYSDSSREGSLDDLVTNKAKTNELDTGTKIKRKRSFNRQWSNQSNRSAGNSSLSSLKNVTNAAKQILPSRKNSYLQHKVDDDTDDSEV